MRVLGKRFIENMGEAVGIWQGPKEVVGPKTRMTELKTGLNAGNFLNKENGQFDGFGRGAP